MDSHIAFVGEIISLSAFGTTLVVLNDKDDAINLLEKRSAIYSDRTVPTMAAEASLYVCLAYQFTRF
jgi:hypothetical protein